MNTVNQRILLCIEIACVTGVAASARAEFDFIRLVDTTTPVPGQPGTTFIGFADPAIDGDTIAFRGRYDDTPSNLEGVYTFSLASGVTKIADESDPLPGGVGNIEFVSQAPRIDGEQVAFLASQLDGAVEGIFTAPVTGGPLVTIADGNSEVPGTGGAETFDFFSDSVALDGGRVLFVGAGTGGTDGVYAASGSGDSELSVVADTTTPIPDAGGETFASFDVAFPASHDISGTSAVFTGEGTTTSGVYSTDVNTGGLTAIVESSVLFDEFFVPRVDGDNVVLLANNSTGPFAVFLTDLTGSTSTTLADSNTTAPGTSDLFDIVFPTDLEDDLVVLNGISGGLTRRGIYTSKNGGPLQKVIDTDDLLETKSLFVLLINNDNLSDDVIVFTAWFADESQAIYAAIQEHHWRPNASGTWDDASNWTFGMLPRSAVPTFIDPENGIVVTGPTPPAHVASLTIGAQSSGLAELALQPTGHLRVDDTLTVEPTGRLRVGGTVSVGNLLDNDGTITGSGQLDADLDNGPGAEVRVAAGQSLLVSGAGGHVNHGLLEAIGGLLEFISPVQNEASTGLIAGRNAVFRFHDGLNNESAVALSFGTSDVFGNVMNSGTVVVAGNSNATFYDDFSNGGTLNVGGGSTAVFFGALSGAGNVGSGEVQALGDLLPGASAGLMDFGGDLTLGIRTNLEIELGGLVAGSQYDQLVVAGDTALNGTLDVVLVDGFTLSTGDVFEIVDVDGVLSGLFTGLAEGASVGNFGGTDLLISYAGGDGNDVTLFVPGLPGDYNTDGVVDAADYTAWRDALGSIGDLRADGDGSGTIDAGDYTVWKTNFGAATAAGSAASQQTPATVPEPAAGLLFIMGCVLFAFWRRSQ